MELWDTDLDLLGPPHLTLGRDGHGAMRFLAIEADLDYRPVEREGQRAVEFSFEGNDEGDRILGRGWAILASNTLSGRIFFHDGDDSGFIAKRQRAGSGVKRR
jgi:hypothetical protein